MLGGDSVRPRLRAFSGVRGCGGRRASCGRQRLSSTPPRSRQVAGGGRLWRVAAGPQRAVAVGWLRCAVRLRLATGPRARLVRRSGHQAEPEWRTAAAACGAPGPCCQRSAAGLPLLWGFYFFFFWGGFLTFLVNL
jgi:hypothetical protein